MPDRAERRRYDDDRARRRLLCVHAADGQRSWWHWGSSMVNRPASTWPRFTPCGSAGAIIGFTRSRICAFSRSIRRRDCGARSTEFSTRSTRRDRRRQHRVSVGRQRRDAARLCGRAAMEHASDSRATSVRFARRAANRTAGDAARCVADRRDSQRDARTRRDVPAVHGGVVRRARRALAAGLQLGAGADDGSRGRRGLAGGRHGAVYNRVEG